MNCLACGGACCETMAIPVSDIKAPSEDAFAWISHHAERSGNCLRFECRCLELTRDGRCGIYEDRPRVCRDYEPGNDDCLDAIRRRRTPEEYATRIREEGDPWSVHPAEVHTGTGMDALEATLGAALNRA